MKNLTLFDTPALKLELPDLDGFYTPVKSRLPKFSQLVLAGALQNEGIDVNIVDMKCQNPSQEEHYKIINYFGHDIHCWRVGSSFEDVQDDIRNTDIIGLTSNFTMQAGIVLDFLSFCRKVNPQAVIVVGGSDADARYQTYLARGADVVVEGEGEIIGRRLLTVLKGGGDISSISGIRYRDISGNIRKNPRNREDMVDLDRDIPLQPFEMVDFKSYAEEPGYGPRESFGPVAYFETSRGCRQACDFCTTPFLRKQYRYASTATIARMLEHFSRFGIKTLISAEDNILSRLDLSYGQGLTEELFDLLWEGGFSYGLVNGIEFGKLMDDGGKINYRLIEKIFRFQQNNGSARGCYRALIPLESLSDNAPHYRKLRSFEDEKILVREIAKMGAPQLSFSAITGRPEEISVDLDQIRDRAESIEDIVNTASQGRTRPFFGIYIIVPLPGTPAFRKYQHNLVSTPEEHPELYTFYLSVIGNGLVHPYAWVEKRLALASHLNRYGGSDVV